MNPPAHLAPVAALEPVLRAHMQAGRHACRLPDDVVRGVVEQGLFRLWIPRRYGGFELTLPMALQVYEAAARAEGSFGWAVMIGSGGGLFAAYLAPEVASVLFGPSAAVVAGSGAPTGTAERVYGGYRVRGRWRYASGADYATVFTANCQVRAQGQPVLCGCEPLIRAMSFSPTEVIIHRTWATSGLRATGSHDIEVIDAFVPEAATFSVLTDAPLESGPLYRVPFDTLTELPVSAVALGIAQHALDAFTSMAHSKPAPGLARPLSGVESVQEAVRAAEACVAGARQALYEQAEQVWRITVAEGRAPLSVLNGATQACVRLVRSLVGAVADLVPLAGMNALHTDDPFAVAWRDLEATAAHYSVSPIKGQATGRRA